MARGAGGGGLLAKVAVIRLLGLVSEVFGNPSLAVPAQRCVEGACGAGPMVCFLAWPGQTRWWALAFNNLWHQYGIRAGFDCVVWDVRSEPYSTHMQLRSTPDVSCIRSNMEPGQAGINEGDSPDVCKPRMFSRSLGARLHASRMPTRQTLLGPTFRPVGLSRTPVSRCKNVLVWGDTSGRCPVRVPTSDIQGAISSRRAPAPLWICQR